MGRFETELLSTNDNLATLANLSGAWIDAVHGRKPLKAVVLDMDSSVSPTHGGQEGTAYNGHFGCTCYNPLFDFNQFGDLERCALRPGNVHSAHGWRDVLEPVVARYRGEGLRRLFRGDAAFALPDIYEFLEADGFGYAIRLPANTILQGNIAHLLKRPVGRPPKQVRRYYANFSYRAASWAKARRVVAKVEWHPVDATVLSQVRRQRRSPATARARLQPRHFLRTLALPDAVEHWSLTALRDRLIKIGGKIVRHGRYVTFQMAEVAIPRDLFADILRRIERLRPKPVPA
jgi:hypothetical protein